MAPALTAHRDAYDTLLDDKLPHRRRASASVNNNILMDDDAMGLQSQPSLAKDSQEMEQILSDLGSADIAQADLLQAIKSFESTGEGLSTGDPESMFPLSGFDLTEADNSEGDSAEDKIRLNQARLERRTMFYLRRVRIFQARAIGKRVAEEVAQTFEKATKGARKDGGGRPLGLKALVKKVETTAALQASAASRSVAGPKYYRAGTSKGDASKAASLGIPSGTFNELEEKAGALRFHLSVVKSALDSDATDSSSGAESDDEAVTYNNPHQQQMPIEKRALWTWQKRRAKIAASASWLQAQIQELDYKIRQHNDLQQSVRAAKGPVEFEGSPGGYEGRLPGEQDTCARARPLRRDNFRKRKLLQMHNLHIATSKAAKPADIRCGCQYPTESCAVCTGRADATRPPPPLSTLPAAQRVALADPGFHPVLSDVTDITPAVHLDALSSRAWFRPRFAKAWRGAHHATAAVARASTAGASATAASGSAGSGSVGQHGRSDAGGKQPKRLKRGRPPLSRKVKERDRDEDTSTSSHERAGGRAGGRGSTESRARRPSFDIDNIVIPQSVAANTRPEILAYKEIITPKWRVMELPEAPMNNGVVKSTRMSFDSEDEDISDSAVHVRHVRAESRERSRYAQKPRARRTPPDTQQPSPDTQTQTQPPSEPQTQPQPPSVTQTQPQAPSVTQTQAQTRSQPRTLPQSQSQSQPRTQSQPQPRMQSQSQSQTQSQAENAPAPEPEPSTSTANETVRPYSPRRFPLPEDLYRDMLAIMPDGYRPVSREPSPFPEDEEDRSSTMSTLSPILDFDGDDPDDAEWEPSIEKGERRKSGHR